MGTKGEDRGKAQGNAAVYEELSPLIEAALRDSVPRGSTTELLRQFQENLTDYLSHEAKDRADIVVEEELQAFRRRSSERLLAMEAEFQRKVRSALSTLQDSVLASMHSQVITLNEDLMRFSHTPGDDLFISSCPVTPTPVQESKPITQVLPEPQETLEAKTPENSVESVVAPVPVAVSLPVVEEVEDGQPHGAWLMLDAPLDLKALMEFYHGLSEMTEVRILETIGSAERGVSFFVMPKAGVSVSTRVRTLAAVKDVQSRKMDDAGAAKGKTSMPGRALRVVLKSTAA